MIAIQTDRLLSVRETAAAFGCSVATVWRWAADGTINQPLKIGGMTRWKQSDVDAAIAKAEAARTTSLRRFASGR
jgi:predicted DNA-binding transcriptional regulator AlpA